MKVLETTYVFDASAQTIVFTNYISGQLKKEQILLITNVVDGIIIYNFADSSKGGTITSDAGGDILTLEYDTTSMNDADELQIFIDDLGKPATETTLSSIDTLTADIKSVLPASLGQKTMANSLPVTIANDQDVLATEGTLSNIDNNTANVDATLGAISDASVAAGGTGSISAKLRRATQGLEDLKSSIVLAAGTNNIGDVDVLTLPSIPAGNNNIGDIDIASIAAGDNNIGNVDVVTLPSIPAGTNNIGDVDVLTLPALVAGTAIIGKVGIDQTTPGTTNGVQVNAALPAGSNAIGKLAANSGVDIGDVDVTSVPADPFGANADAAVAAGATGSMQAKFRRMTQGLEDLKSLIVLAAGTNAIGKLAANSGVDIGDVDVTSLPALAAGTNLIGKTAAGLRTDAVANGTTDVTPKFAKIDRATNADGAAVVNLVSAKKIRVLTLTLVSAGTVSVKWQSSTSNSSGAGSNTDLSGLMSLVANTGMADVFSPVGLFETVAGEALKLNLNAAVQVSGYLTYLEI